MSEQTDRDEPEPPPALERDPVDPLHNGTWPPVEDPYYEPPEPQDND